MNQRFHLDPPAPPPFWQSEPLLEAKRHGFEWTSSTIGIAAIIGFSCFILLIAINRLRDRWRFDTRAEERRLRAILAQNANIGPDAAWLSASVIAARLDEKAVTVDESTSRMLDRLKELEMQRFGPGLAE